MICIDTDADAIADAIRAILAELAQMRHCYTNDLRYEFALANQPGRYRLEALRIVWESCLWYRNGGLN